VNGTGYESGLAARRRFTDSIRAQTPSTIDAACPAVAWIARDVDLAPIEPLVTVAVGVSRIADARAGPGVAEGFDVVVGACGPAGSATIDLDEHVGFASVAALVGVAVREPGVAGALALAVSTLEESDVVRRAGETAAAAILWVGCNPSLTAVEPLAAVTVLESRDAGAFTFLRYARHGCHVLVRASESALTTVIHIGAGVDLTAIRAHIAVAVLEPCGADALTLFVRALARGDVVRGAGESATSAVVHVRGDFRFASVDLFVGIAVAEAPKAFARARAARAGGVNVVRGARQPAAAAVGDVLQGIAFASVRALVTVAVEETVAADAGFTRAGIAQGRYVL
jgi:hypothetical protein